MIVTEEKKRGQRTKSRENERRKNAPKNRGVTRRAGGGKNSGVTRRAGGKKNSGNARIVWLLVALLACLSTWGGYYKEEIRQAAISIGSLVSKEAHMQAESSMAKPDNTVPDDNSVQTGGSLEIHFLDVGQGDAALLVSDGHAMLVDAGEEDKGTAVQLYLKKQGIKKLDYVIGTHPHSDHIGGMDVVLTKYKCNTLIMPDYESDSKAYREVREVMKYERLPNSVPAPGQTYPLGSAAVTVIAPQKSYEDANNSSVGILITHGENRFLLTGDAEAEAEADILASGVDISADVYKAGHHGSATSSTEAFVNRINPRYAVISCGEDNAYGHPHGEVLNRFRQKGIQVFRTDEQGSIVAYSNGKEITFNCAPSESWKAGEKQGK